MSRYELFHPDAEILGQVILDFKQAIGSGHFQHYFESRGLVNLQPDVWYPAQPWVDVLNDIAALGSGKAMFDFVSIGIRQLELAVMPPEMDSIPLQDALCSIEEAYRLNYRGTDVGSIQAEAVDQGHIRLIVRSFEPDDLWYGNLHGFMRRFAPPGLKYRVYYDPALPRREQGGAATVLHVVWQ